MIEIDFSGVRQETPPDGDYIFVISDAEVKPSKKGDSDVIHLTLEVESPTEYAGRRTLAWISLHHDALWAAQPFFDAVMNEQQNGKVNLEASSLVNEKVGATCQQKEAQNGRMVLVPVSWWPPSGMRASFYSEGEEPI